MTYLKTLLSALLVLLLTACNIGTETTVPMPTTVVSDPATATAAPAASPTDAPVQPTATSAASVATPTAAPQPPTLTPVPTDIPVEPSDVTPTPAIDPATIPPASIVIAQPGPGSRVTSPVTVRGESDSTFEQNLIIRVISADGEVITQLPTTIQSELGQRGDYEAALEFDVDETTQAFIQVFADSPMDGAVVVLSSVGVQLLPPSEAAQEEILENPDALEHIVITSPAPGDLITGGVVSLEGFGRAGFENTLVAELRDIDGNLLANYAMTLAAPLGEYGRFSTALPYTVTGETQARLTVRDVSPAHGGDAFLRSINIRLAP